MRRECEKSGVLHPGSREEGLHLALLRSKRKGHLEAKLTSSEFAPVESEDRWHVCTVNSRQLGTHFDV